MFFQSFYLAWEERANLSAFRKFVRFALVWFYLLPLPLGVWEGLRLVIVALPGLFSYPFLSPDISRWGLLKRVRPSVLPSEIPSVRRHNEMGSLWTQLLLQCFSVLPIFLKLCKCFCHGLKMCIWFWGFPPFILLINFFHFLVFFQVRLLLKMDTEWAQLFLEFSPII